MKIVQHGDTLIVSDGTGARYGVGIVVPAIVVGVGLGLISPAVGSDQRVYQGALAFLATALALVVLNSPRVAEFDPKKREVRLTIGWPPLVGQHMRIPFDTIRGAEVSQLVNLGYGLGSARPVLILESGEKVFVSTYKRSPRQAGEIVEKIRQVLSRRS